MTLNFYTATTERREASECVPGTGYCVEIPVPLPPGDPPEDDPQQDSLWDEIKTNLDPIRTRIREARATVAKSVIQLTGRPFTKEGFFTIPAETEPEYSKPLADLMESVNILMHDNLRSVLRDAGQHLNRTKYKGPVKVAMALSPEGAIRLVWVKDHQHAKHEPLTLEAVGHSGKATHVAKR